MYNYDFTGNSYNGLGSLLDSATYIYSGDNLTKIDRATGGTYNITYDAAGKVTKVEYFTAGGLQPYLTRTVTYNNDGSINRMEYFDPALYPRRYVVDFLYTAGKVTKITGSSYTGADVNVLEEHRYTWTGNNITRQEYTDSSSPGTLLQDTLIYTYDTNPNVFTKQNSMAWLSTVDPYFSNNFSGGAYHLPMIGSANNVTTYNGHPVTYKLDDKQNVTEMDIDGNKAVTYTHQCQ
jgi:hypothetical protein